MKCVRCSLWFGSILLTKKKNKKNKIIFIVFFGVFFGVFFVVYTLFQP